MADLTFGRIWQICL